MQKISFAVMALIADSAAVKIYPLAPTGLVPQRVDDQYEGVQQLKKPLNWENAT